MVSITAGTRDEILAVARARAQSHGYQGLNFRDLADTVGIKAASVYYYFPSKAELGVAVARRYWQDSESELATLLAESGSPVEALARYPSTFRRALENGNRLCMSSFMAAERDQLPDAVREEVDRFSDVHVRWLAARLVESKAVTTIESDVRASAMFAAIAGSQLFARSRSGLATYDALIDAYRAIGLIPG